SPSRETTPLALRAEVEYTNTFHERVLLVSVDQVSVPQVEDDERFTVEKLGGRFTVWHVSIRVGYQEKMNVPAALRLCRKQGALERNLDLENAKYLLSRITIAPTDAPPLTYWRKRLFIAMARNAASPIEAFRLPRESTVIIGSQVALWSGTARAGRWSAVTQPVADPRLGYQVTRPRRIRLDLRADVRDVDPQVV